MDPALFLALGVGAFGVLQAGLNKKVGVDAGLSGAALVNSLVMLTAIGAFFALERLRPDLVPDAFRGRLPGRPEWWWVLPGLSGFFIVFGFPWAIGRIGATTAVVLLIAAQIVAGVVWDGLAEGHWPGAWKLAGAALVGVGAIMASLK